MPSTALEKIRRVRAIVIKEFFQAVRDPSSILISIVLPMILMFLYGFGVSLDLDHLKVGLAIEDRSPDAHDFARALTDSPYFSVRIAGDRRELIPDLLASRIRGIIVIPSTFSAFLKDPNQVAQIQIIADGSETNTANFVQNYTFGAWQSWRQQRQLQRQEQVQPIAYLESRFWYNEQLESRNFLIPGSLAIIMTLIGTLLTALVVSREWERGTMEALMATPITIGELLCGKLIPYFILGMCSMAICVSVAVFLYGVPMRGSVIVLVGISALFLITALGLGLVISAGSRNQFVASQKASMAAFLPSYMLSGFIFEIPSMPEPIQWVTVFIPARYFVGSMQTLFLVGNVWPLLMGNILPLCAITAFFYIIAAKKSTKRLD